MSGRVYVGDVAPLAFVADVTPGDSGLDLSTVTAASVRVTKGDGSVAVWPCTLSNQTSSTLRLTHPFDVGDLSVAGSYVTRGLLTTPDGVRPTDTGGFAVHEEG